MTDDEIRTLVRAKLTDGTLPRQNPVIAGTGEILLGQGRFPVHPCAVCGGVPSGVCYYPDRPGPRLAFHERCWEIWLAEIDRR